MPRRTNSRRALVIARIAIAALAFIAGERAGAASDPVPFPLELACGTGRLSLTDHLALSPDGAHVAYTVVSAPGPSATAMTRSAAAPPLAASHRLYVAATATGAIREVTTSSDGHAAAWAPSWSPDSTVVAFYGEAPGADGASLEIGLWTYRVGAAAASRLGKVVVGTAESSRLMRPEWTADGAFVLVPQVAPEAASAQLPTSDPSATASPSTSIPSAAPTVDVRTTGAERAVAGVAPAESPGSFSQAAPQGQSLVAGPAAALVAVALRDAQVTTIVPAGDRPAFLGGKPSPSGSFIACESALRTGPGPALEVLVDLTIVRRSDGAIVHAERGIPLDPNLDPTAPTLVALAWHPTADRLAYLAGSVLRVVDLTSGAAAVTEPPVGADAVRAVRVAFTRDGAALLVSIAAADAPLEDPALACIRSIRQDGAESRDLVAPPGVRLRGLVTADGRSAWQPDDGALVGVGTDLATGDAVFLRLPLDGSGSGLSTVTWRVAGSMRFVAATQNPPRAIARIEDSSTPPDYYVADAGFERGVRLSVAEPRLTGVQIGSEEEYSTRLVSGDGTVRTLRSAVMLPPAGKAGGPYPTLVALYPGSSLRAQGRAFGGGMVATLPSAIFVSRGYAVLLADVPLAPLGIPSDPLDDIRDAVLAQLHRAAELGYVDLDRVGVIGHSFGAYGAACLVSSTNAFAAAIAIDGAYDLPGIYAMQRPDEPALEGTCLNMLLLETHQGRMGKPLWDDPQRYIDNSPYFRADRIRTPLLLVHGREDTNCPAGESDKLFNALVRLGRTAQVAIYSGEGHVPDEWSPANRVDLASRTLAFLDRHLKKP